jgi:hypothetical protein
VGFGSALINTTKDSKKYDFMGPVLGNTETYDRTKLGESYDKNKGVANNRATKNQKLVEKYCKVERVKFCTEGTE